jgi:hypothetical protein
VDASVRSASDCATVLTWDALFSNPSAFDALPPAAQATIYEQVAVMEAKLRAKALARRERSELVIPVTPERVVGVKEACPLLGMTQDFLYRNWRKLDLGGYRDDDGHVKFPLSAIQRHIRRKGDR